MSDLTDLQEFYDDIRKNVRWMLLEARRLRAEFRYRVGRPLTDHDGWKDQDWYRGYIAAQANTYRLVAKQLMLQVHFLNRPRNGLVLLFT